MSTERNKVVSVLTKVASDRRAAAEYKKAPADFLRKEGLSAGSIAAITSGDMAKIRQVAGSGSLGGASAADNVVIVVIVL